MSAMQIASDAAAGGDAGPFAVPGPNVAIRTRALSLRLGRKQILDALDLDIEAGQIHALIGANGAGKSTLFRILLGFRPASGGQAWILGRRCDALTPQDRGRIGFVNEEHSLPGWLRVKALMAMQRAHYPRWDQRRFDEVIGHYNVLPEQRISQLSRGERAGVNLAMTLAQRPELLILDEPTLGLDVVARRAFLESLLLSRDEGDATVVYCSHQMEEIERVADQMIVLERGAIRVHASPDEFLDRVSLWIADIPFKGPDAAVVPGLLQQQRIDGLFHYLVLDQGDHFAEFLRSAGARSVQRMPVSLDQAVNGYLGQRHAMPNAA